MPESNWRTTTKDVAWQETWGSSKFIEQWAAKGGWQAPIREVQTAMVLRMLPQPIDATIRVLDLGAGYGALAAAVLNDRPNATAVCLDASAAMLDLGRERNSNLGSRIKFIQASLETPDWRNSVQGRFDAVISARALHHLLRTSADDLSLKKCSSWFVMEAVLSMPTTCGRRLKPWVSGIAVPAMNISTAS